MSKEQINFCCVSFGTLGDFLMLLSVCEKIHTHKPDVRIVIVALRGKKMLQELAESYEYITFVDFLKEQPLTIMRFVAQYIFKKNIFFIPPTFAPVSSMIKCIGVLVTCMRRESKCIGFTDGSNINPYLYDRELHFDLSLMFYQNIYKILPIMGIPSEGTPQYRFGERITVLDMYGLSSGHYIVCNPFAGSKRRSLPKDRWIDILRFLKEQFPQYAVLLVGAHSDFTDAADMLVESQVEGRNLCGVISLTEVATLIKHNKLFVGVDSGLSHLASVIGVSALIIGNLSNPTWLPFYSPQSDILFEKRRCVCRGNKTGDCFETIDGVPYYRCMLDISQEKIKQTISQKLG